MMSTDGMTRPGGHDTVTLTTGKTCPVKDILTRIEFQQRLKGMKANGLLSTGGDRCSGNPIDAILLAYNCTMCTEVNAVDLLLGF